MGIPREGSSTQVWVGFGQTIIGLQCNGWGFCKNQWKISQRALQLYYYKTTVVNYRAKFHVFCCFCTFDSDDPEKAKIKLVDGVLS